MAKRKYAKGVGPRTGFLAPLTPKAWKKEARARAKLRFRPERRAIKGEMRASKARQRGIRKMFNQYGQSVDKAAQRTTGAYSQAQQQIGQTAQTSSNYAETLRQRLAQEGMKDAERRGTSYDSSGSNINAEAQFARLNAANVLSGVTASQGATQAAHLAGRKAAGQRASVQARMGEVSRRRQGKADLRDLAKQRGEFMVADRGQAREGERQYHLGLLAARDKKGARRFAGRQAKFSRRSSRREARKNRNFQRKENAKNRKASSKSGGKSKRPGTKKQRRQARAYFRQGTTGVNALINRGVNPAVARRIVKRQKAKRRKAEQDAKKHFAGSK